MDTYVNACCVDIDMVRYHAEKYDNTIFGSMILYALGIRAACTTFCKSARYEGRYVLSWICDNGDEYHDIVSEEEIMAALEKVKIVFRTK